MESNSNTFQPDFQGIDFNHIDLDLKQAHIALEKIQEIAIFDLAKLDTNLKKEAEIREYFAETSSKDISMILNIKNELGNISKKNEILRNSLEKRPTVLTKKATQLKNDLINEKGKIVYDTTDQDIQKLQIERKQCELEMKENLIQITYDKLSQVIDKFEIECMKAFSGLILNLINPKSSQIEALLRVYSELFKQIIKLDPISVSSIVADDINIHLIDIFAKFESPRFEYQKKNYIHLLPFLKWANAVIQINLLQRNQIKFLHGKIQRLANKLDIIEELKSSPSLILLIEKENMDENFVEKSLSFIKQKGEIKINLEEIAFSKSDYLRKAVKEFNEINHQNDHLIEELINPIIDKEHNFRQFVTGVDISNTSILSKRFCGFC